MLYIFLAAVQYTRLHILTAAEFLLFIAPTCSCHSLWPSSGNYKLHRYLQLNLWSWTKNNCSRTNFHFQFTAQCLLFKSWSFRGDRIQCNVLGQTAASKCQGLQTAKIETCLNLGSTGTPWRRWTESVPETSVNLKILTRLSAREHFNEYLLFTASACFVHRM